MNRIKNRLLNIYITAGKFIRKYKFIGISAIVLPAVLILLNACEEELDPEDIYTVQVETVGEYLSNRPETFSEFTKMLEKTEVIGLLSTYGKYTCFAPNNNAVQDLYDARGKESIDDFHIDTLTKIVYDHIIKDFKVTSAEFVNGFLPNLTMSGRYIRIDIEAAEGALVYKVNETSLIGKKDVEAHNGVVHTLEEVLQPTENTLLEVIAGEEDYTLFYDALIETGLYEKLTPIKDDSYDPGTLLERDGTVQPHGIVERIPRERKYGFTALIESNDTYKKNGITNLEEMKAYAKNIYDNMYPDDAGITDVTDSANSFNRFVAYHLINKKISSKFFIERFDNSGEDYDTKGETHSIKDVDMSDYIETMCPNTLIEVRTLRFSNEYNIFNMIESGEAVRLTDDYDNDALNGVFHGIDTILAYTTEVDRMLKSKRLRMDGASFFPELVNNNMRVGHATPDYPSENWMYPQGYFDRLTTSPSTIFGYINADDRFCDFQGDEIFIEESLYDFEIITLPIPAGTYEIRFGYQPTPFRGAAQFYWDGIPAGIPLDLTFDANNPIVGFEVPGSNADDPEGFENDKMMHNRGYMKGPASFKAILPTWYTGEASRNDQNVLRKVLGIYTFDKTETHKFKVSSIRRGQFMFDYLEFVPLEVLQKEDIY